MAVSTGRVGAALVVLVGVITVHGQAPLVQGGNAAQVLAMGFGTVSFGGNAPNVTSQPPAADDWGAIRKYGWVVSRGLD